MTLPKWKQALKNAASEADKMELWNTMNVNVSDHDIHTNQSWQRLENIYNSNKLLELLIEHHGEKYGGNK